MAQDFYLPDNAATLALLSEEGRRQQGRIGQAGEAYAEGQGNIGRAVSQGLQAFDAGNRLRQSEENSRSSRAASDAQTAAANFHLSEEQKNAALLDAAGADGKSRREAMATDDASFHHLQAQREQFALDHAPDEFALKKQEAEAAIAASRASQGVSGFQLKTAQEMHDEDVLKGQIRGIALDSSIPPAAKDSRIQELVQSSRFGGKADAGRALGIANQALLEVRTGQATAANANELAQTSLPGYGDVRAATGTAHKGLIDLQNLQKLKEEYTGNLNFGAGAALGGEINNPKASDAREQFAQAMDQITPGSGDDLRKTFALQSVGDKMQRFIQEHGSRVQRNWQTERGLIDPRFQQRPEVQQTDAAFAQAFGNGQPGSGQVAGQGQQGKGTFDLVGRRAGGMQNSNRSVVYGNQPGQPGTAMAMPQGVPPPAQPGAAPPAQPPPGAAPTPAKQPLQIDWTQFQRGP